MTGGDYPEGDADPVSVHQVPKLRPLFSGDEGLSEASPEKPPAGEAIYQATMLHRESRSQSLEMNSPREPGAAPQADRPDAAEDVPRLAPLEALLPMALERLERLEKIVAEHQTQFNELVPLQRDILNVHSVLCSHHNATFQTCEDLRQAHEELCEEHDVLCSSLASTGLVDKDNRPRRAQRRRARASASAAALGGAVEALDELIQTTWQTGAAESLARAAGPEAWEQLLLCSRSLAFGRLDQAPALVAAPLWNASQDARPEDAGSWEPMYPHDPGRGRVEQSFYGTTQAATPAGSPVRAASVQVVHVDLHDAAVPDLPHLRRASLQSAEGFE